MSEALVNLAPLPEKHRELKGQAVQEAYSAIVDLVNQAESKGQLKASSREILLKALEEVYQERLCVLMVEDQLKNIHRKFALHLNHAISGLVAPSSSKDFVSYYYRKDDLRIRHYTKTKEHVK